MANRFGIPPQMARAYAQAFEARETVATYVESQLDPISKSARNNCLLDEEEKIPTIKALRSAITVLDKAVAKGDFGVQAPLETLPFSEVMLCGDQVLWRLERIAYQYIRKEDVSPFGVDGVDASDITHWKKTFLQGAALQEMGALPEVIDSTKTSSSPCMHLLDAYIDAAGMYVQGFGGAATDFGSDL